MNKYFLSFIPFFIFIFTYTFLVYFFQQKKIYAPQVAGFYFRDLPTILGPEYSFRLYKVSCNKEYEDGYILSQYPLYGAVMKNNQIINLEVISNIKNNSIKYTGMFLDDFIALSKKGGEMYSVICFDYNRSNSEKEFVFSSIYDSKRDRNILYSMLKNNLDTIYVYNSVGKNCYEVSENISGYQCHDCISEDKENFKGCDKVVKTQYPLPGIYLKSRNNFILHVWH